MLTLRAWNREFGSAIEEARVEYMNKIEMVITQGALDLFKERARAIGISEFYVAEVLWSSGRQAERQRLYRGQSFMVDLLARSKVEFTASDEDTRRVVEQLSDIVQPERITIFKLEQLDSHAGKHNGHDLTYPIGDKVNRLIHFEDHRHN